MMAVSVARAGSRDLGSFGRSRFRLLLTALVITAATTSVPAAPARALSPTTAAHLDEITDHIYRGSPHNGAPCGMTCTALWISEHDPGQSEEFQRELRTLRARVGIMPRLRELQNIPLKTGTSTFGWKIGLGTNAKFLRLRVPERQVTGGGYSHAEWVGLGWATARSWEYFGARWPEENGWLGFFIDYRDDVNNRWFDSRCDFSGHTPPAPLITRGPLASQNTACLGGIPYEEHPDIKVLYAYLSEDALGALGPMEDYTGQAFDAESPAPGDPGYDVVRERIRAELQGDGYPNLNGWYDQQFGAGPPPPPPSPGPSPGPPPPLPGPNPAAYFAPRLRFDSSERWRPLNIPPFISEGHRVCRIADEGDCRPVSSEIDLASYGEDWFLDVNGKKSSSPTCSGGLLFDCNSGPYSKIYFTYRPPGTNPYPAYHFFDYWFYYRFNDAPLGDLGDLGDHEGDWEGVLVAVNQADPARFEWVAFAQHKKDHKGFAYLSPILGCGGGEGSCADNPTRVDVFVANGTHASYPDRCRKRAPTSCRVIEGGHDGRHKWGNNEDPTAVHPFAPTPAWPHWRGLWGTPIDNPGGELDHRVRSPGPRSRWKDGIEFRSARSSGRRARISATRSYGSCDRWFGASLSLVACNPSELRASLRAGTLDRPGGLALQAGVRGTRAASTPGLAQLLSDPLRPGQRARLSGRAARGTQLSVRAIARNALVEARFDHLGLERGGAAAVSVSQRRGIPALILRQPNGKTVRPKIIRRIGTRRPARPAKVRAVKRGRRVILSFRARARRTVVALQRTPKGRQLSERTLRTRPGRTERVRLRYARGTRFIVLGSLDRNGLASKLVAVRIRRR